MYGRRLTLLGLVMSLAVLPSVAVDPTTLITQYGHQAWRMQDGYFGGTVTSIAQTADGYVWIGTVGGLVRFDGVRFVPWVPPSGQQLPSPKITSLFGAHDGSLWIGASDGLSRWAGNRLTNFRIVGTISSILEDRNGTIWFVRDTNVPTDGLLCKIGVITTQCFGRSQGMPVTAALPLEQDGRGNLWVGGTEEVVRWRPDSSSVFDVPTLGPNQGSDGVEALASDPDGSMWVGIPKSGAGRGLLHLGDGKLESFHTPDLDGSALKVASLFRDREGALWIGTVGQGIYRVVDGRIDHYQTIDGLSGGFVRRFMEDREGNLWVVTSRGIDLFHDLPVVTWSTREGLGMVQVLSVLAARGGGVWAGGGSALDALRHGRVFPIQAEQSVNGKMVRQLLEDREGRLWVGLDNTLEIYNNGRFAEVRKNDGNPIGPVSGLAEDVEGNIWALAFDGSKFNLLRIRDDRVQGEFSSTPLARKVAASPEGGIWLGLLDGNLTRFVDGQAETFRYNPAADAGTTQTRAQNVLDGKDVEQMMVDQDGSVLGATTFGLIGWKRGKQQILTERNGLPCDWVHSLVTDSEGNLWLYMQCGLVEIAATDIAEWWGDPDRTVHTRLFDTFDGVTPARATFNGAARSIDGRLWFANNDVLQMIDPGRTNLNLAPPPVHIQQIMADGKSYPTDAGLRIPPRPSNLEIDYTALSFAVPQKVHFRYLLEGHDKAWQDPGTRRQAFYSDLRPGHYLFHVTACNNDGVWNTQGATLAFTISPAWFQTIWFATLCLLAVLIAMWLAYRHRVRRVEQVLSLRFDERLEERTRVARDLHDTLLQTIDGSKLVADDALHSPGNTAQLRHTVDQLSRWLGRASQEGRAALNALRDPAAEVNFADAIKRAIEDCRKQASTEVRLSQTGLTQLIHPTVRDEILRIGDEAIRNACAHSQATRVDVLLNYDHDFSLRVADNGIGIDPVLLQNGRDDHFGLKGMRERAARIGGKLTITKTRGGGAEITLTVPRRIAFRTKRSSLTWKIRSFFE